MAQRNNFDLIFWEWDPSDLWGIPIDESQHPTILTAGLSAWPF